MMCGAERVIAILVFEGVQTLDIAAPLDASAAVNALRPDSYAPVIVGLDENAVASETGMRILPTGRIDALQDIDTLIIPGGAGVRVPGAAQTIASAVRGVEEKTRRLVSVCTGIYGLAPTGLLDGLRVTTHWRFAADVAKRFPNLQVEPDALYIEAGRIHTAAGVTAALDLALSLIEADHGAAVALAVARDLVVYMKRVGGQQQYSEPLRFQSRAVGPFGELANWIAANLAHPLSTPILAERVHLSVRQFNRRFLKLFEATPGQYIERLRLDAARRKLTDTNAQISQIAHSVGFASADVFSRTFHRCFGLTPSDYRLRFSMTYKE